MKGWGDGSGVRVKRWGTSVERVKRMVGGGSEGEGVKGAGGSGGETQNRPLTYSTTLKITDDRHVSAALL